MRGQRCWAMFLARNQEYLRDRTTLTWNLAFPILLVFGFAIAFSGPPDDLFKVGYRGTATNAVEGFLATDYIQFVAINDLQRAITRVERHQLDMYLDLETGRYWLNRTSRNGYLLDRILAGTGAYELQQQPVSGDPIRYVDWVLPGVLAMNMMFSCLFGVGYVIVRYRKNGVLKRLKATPLAASEFLIAQMLSRLWLILTVTALIYIGTDLFVDFRMYGNHLNLLLTFTIGGLCLISLSLIVAARTTSEELAGGLLNLLSWPMLFLSGIWFSLEGIHPLLQQLAWWLPLTHIVQGARAIMVDGASLSEVAPQLLSLLGMTGVFLTIGTVSFRWD